MWLNVKLKTKRRNSITVIPLKLVSFRENLCFRNTSISIINYMHFSFVWSRLTLTTAILFPLESCPNNIFHIPAFIIGNINVTMGQTILILLIRYRWVAFLQRFLTSRISFSVLPKWTKRIVSVKKEKRKKREWFRFDDFACWISIFILNALSRNVEKLIPTRIVFQENLEKNFVI